MKLLLSANVAFLLLSSCMSQEDATKQEKEGNLRRQLEPEDEIFDGIIMGEDAPIDRYPYYAGIFQVGAEKPYCGGTLIHDEWVLTAAHCPAEFGQSVKIGLYNTETCFNGGQDLDLRTVKEVYFHPKATGTAADGWDVALIKLSHPSSIDPVQYDDGCSHVRLKPGDPLDVFGFGRTIGVDPTSAPDTLQLAEVDYIKNRACQRLWGEGVDILDNMMCAAADDMSACRGDSGGPLVKVGRRNKDLQVGVVSFGPVDCVIDGPPTGYARLGDKDIADFIYKTITGKRGRHRCGRRKKKPDHKRSRSS